MAYDYRLILCAKGKGVLKITLNQPETLNALTPDLERELHAALQEGDNDPEVFCMVICGTGRAFSSGYAMGAVPQVAAHDLDVPRIGYVHSWQRTQDEGWVRAALDTWMTDTADRGAPVHRWKSRPCVTAYR